MISAASYTRGLIFTESPLLERSTGKYRERLEREIRLKVHKEFLDRYGDRYLARAGIVARSLTSRFEEIGREKDVRCQLAPD